VVGVDVVGVLVGDEHRVGSGEGLAAREHPRVQQQGDAVVLDPHARVAELREAHGATPPVRIC
jgi:hypothetical protein